MSDLTRETLAELRRLLAEFRETTPGRATGAPFAALVDALLTHADALLDAADRLAHMTEARDNARAEVERLTAILDGRCLSDITHRDEEHRQSVCMLPEGHAPLMHDDCLGCTWTDADHWQPQAVDRLADELRAVADESQREGWDSPAVRCVVERLTSAFDGGAVLPDLLADAWDEGHADGLHNAHEYREHRKARNPYRPETATREATDAPVTLAAPDAINPPPDPSAAVTEPHDTEGA